MVQTTFNLFDLIVLFVLGMSGLLSFFRGFVREIFSLGAWVGAGIITLYVFPDVAEWLKPQVKNTMVASGFASLFTFMTALLGFSIFNSLLFKFLKSGSEVGMLDNLIGLTFGLARGALLVSVGYFVFSLTTAKENYPDWMEGSVTLPYVEKASNWVASFAPKYLEEITPGVTKKTPGHAPTREDGESATHWPTMGDLRKKMDENASDGDK